MALLERCGFATYSGAMATDIFSVENTSHFFVCIPCLLPFTVEACLLDKLKSQEGLAFVSDCLSGSE